MADKLTEPMLRALNCNDCRYHISDNGYFGMSLLQCSKGHYAYTINGRRALVWNWAQGCKDYESITDAGRKAVGDVHD